MNEFMFPHVPLPLLPYHDHFLPNLLPFHLIHPSLVAGVAALRSLMVKNGVAGMNLPGASAAATRFVMHISHGVEDSGETLTFGVTQLNVVFDVKVGSEDVQISLRGTFHVHIPCETGDTIAGAASLSMRASGKLELSATSATVGLGTFFRATFRLLS